MYVDLNIPVKQIMTRSIRYVSPKTLMSEVASIFNTSPFHHIPVVDEDGKVCGIISKTDYHQLQNHFTRLSIGDWDEKNNRFLSSLTAEEVMSAKPICIHHEATIRAAVEIFMENLFRALPVVEEGRIVGIITPQDILSFIHNQTVALP